MRIFGFWGLGGIEGTSRSLKGFCKGGCVPSSWLSAGESQTKGAKRHGVLQNARGMDEAFEHAVAGLDELVAALLRGHVHLACQGIGGGVDGSIIVEGTIGVCGPGFR